MNEEWGPLANLIGTWEGDEGLDLAYSHQRQSVIETPYREKAEFKPFGPVQNGKQTLMGLDYRTAMWKENEELPFHTEVGYWLWDADAKVVLRCFVVPRGVTVLAGGRYESDIDGFTLTAEAGSERYGISQNLYLAKLARTTHYETTFRFPEDGVAVYTEHTMLEMAQLAEPLDHADSNTLRRVG